MSRRKCRRYRVRIARAVDRPGVGDLGLRRHLKTCERCRSELAQYRSIGKALRSIPQGRVTKPTAKPTTKARGPIATALLRPAANRLGTAGVVAVALLGALGAAGATAARHRP